MTINKYVISLGSNINRKNNLRSALSKIENQFEIDSVSNEYEFDCVNNHENPKYLNQIIIINSELSSEEVNTKLKEIEFRLDKIKTKSQCTIDIDLVFIINSNNHLATFKDKSSTILPYIVLPCAELIPHLFHPEKQQRFLELKNQLKEISLC